MMQNTTLSIRDALFLCFIVAVYSCAGLFTKMASGHEVLSVKYLMYFACVIIILGVYAILWQIALKRIPLSQAYPFRSLSIVFGVAIANSAFGESVTLHNLLGCGLVITGILILLRKQ